MANRILIMLLFFLNQSAAIACFDGEDFADLKELKNNIYENPENYSVEQVKLSLDAYRSCLEGEVDFIYGEMYFFGTVFQKNEDKSIDFLEQSVEQGNTSASYLLGTILSTSGIQSKKTRGIDLLLLAANSGNRDAKFNLYALYQEGIYSNRTKAFVFLKEAAEEGDEDAAIAFADKMREVAISYDNEAFAVKGLEILEKTDFVKNKAISEFIFARIYGEPSFSFSDETRSKEYLKNSAEMGFQRAIDLWTEYQRSKKIEEQQLKQD